MLLDGLALLVVALDLDADLLALGRHLLEVVLAEVEVVLVLARMKPSEHLLYQLRFSSKRPREGLAF